MTCAVSVVQFVFLMFGRVEILVLKWLLNVLDVYFCDQVVINLGGKVREFNFIVLKIHNL